MSSAEEIDAAAGSSVQLDSTEAVVIKVEEQLRETAEVIFEADFQFYKMETKIHRFPPGLRGLGDQYVVPMVLAIGPYHRDLPRLQEMAMVKHVATHYFIHDASREATYEEIYDEFFPVAAKARSSYARGAVAGIQEAEFVDMMFHDACFLLQYMQCMLSSVESSEEKFDVDPSLRRFFFSNRACIDNDVMLLENQLPWTVLHALSKFSHVKIEDFVALMGKRFQISEDLDKVESFVLDPEIYYTPHLLGLLRVYKTSLRSVRKQAIRAPYQADRLVSETISASMLARNGIKLRPSEATEFYKMEVRKGFLFDEFFISPLSVDGTTASWLVNMVAYEVCTASRFVESDERTAVSSYLALLAMLMKEEGDVHLMRAKGFLRGELTDKKMLGFFNVIAEQVSPGIGYFQVLASIEASKRRRLRWMQNTAYKFVSDNYKTIAAVFSIIGVLVGIFKALFSLKQHQQ